MAETSKQKQEQEEQWKADEDARTLARSMMIMEDPERVQRARKAAKKLLEQQEEWAEEAELERQALARLSGKGKMGSYSKKFNEMYG